MARAYLNYGQTVAFTPQTQAIPGREAEMVANNAGGYGFVLDDWERLMRFLILGSDGGTYYVGEQKLTAQNAEVAIRCIKADGVRVIELACNVNVNNRAPKVGQQLFVLALAMKHGDQATKNAVRAAASKMLRTGTHLLHFVAMLDSLGGWNRSKRRLIADWFGQEPDKVAFQCLKYQRRDSWSMRDVLRVAHVKPFTPEHNPVLAWVVGKDNGEMPGLPKILQCYRYMSEAVGTENMSCVEAALVGIKNGLPREALPTEALSDLSVQRAMLPDMPIHALIRNLGNLTASGLFDGSGNPDLVAAKLMNKETLRRSRVHPFAILLATLVYKSGAGFRGSKTWVPNATILAALEDAYDLAFDSVTPTGRRILIGIDVSASMSSHSCIGTPIKASTAAAAMAITLARLEPHATVITFDTEFRKIVPITKRTGIASLDNARGGGTDLTAPVRWAMQSGVLRGKIMEKQAFDAVVLLTDNETWAGSRHSTQALAAYRKEIGLPVKLVCCSFAANHASVVDPQDPLQFGCAGLDANLPSLVSDFIGR